MGDMADMVNVGDVYEDDEDEDEYCIDCGHPIGYCCCDHYIPDLD